MGIIFFQSRRLFKHLINIHNSQFYYSLINKPLLIVFGLIFIQYPLSVYLTGTYTYYFTVLFLISLMAICYSKIGYLSFLMLVFYYFEDLVISYYLKSRFDSVIMENISIYFKFSNLSLLVSVIFIIIIYNEGQVIKLYNKIYNKMLLLKVLMDVGLVTNFVYGLYDQLNHEYIEVIHHTSNIIFTILAIHYILIYLAIYLKVNLKISHQTFDSMFGDLNILIASKDKNSSYIEIKFYKVSNT
jgi:hypothetical protein